MACGLAPQVKPYLIAAHQSVEIGHRVALEYLAREHGQPSTLDDVHRRLEEIPARLTKIWDESKASGRSADQVADSMAQKLIGR